MEGKKKYFALIIFLFLGLMIFTFANPAEEEKEFKGGDKEQSETVTNKREDTTEEDDEEEQEQQQDANQQQEANQQQNVTTNNNQGNAQGGNQGNNPGQTPVNPVDNTLRDALAAVEKAEGTYTQKDVDAAKQLVNQVTDTTEKGKLEERLDEVEAGIAALALLENLETQVEEALEKADMTNATSYRDTNEIAKKIEDLNNETVKETLQERLDKVSKLLDDNAAPTTKVKAKAYNDNVEITAEDEAGNPFKMYLTKGNEKEKGISSGDKTTSDGVYTLRLIDEAFNEQTVTFTVDTVAPVLKDLTNGAHYPEITLTVEDLTKTKIEVTNMDKNETTVVEDGTKLTEDATYKVVLTDEAGNTTEYWLAIDSTNPTIENVDDGSFINSATTALIKDKFLTNVVVSYVALDGTETKEEFTRANFSVEANNENFSYEYTLDKEGTYTITAEDKIGNTSTKTVIVDMTPAKKNAVNINVNGYKNTVNEQYATNGNKISAYISINEELKQKPKFTFYANGKKIKEITDEVVISNSSNEKYPYIYTANLEINEELVAEDGLITFTVSNIYDKAGNKTEDITKITTKKVITLDRTAAARVYSTIRSNQHGEVSENGKDIDYYHTNGTKFEYAISFNELLKEAPTVTVGGRNVEMKLNEKVLKNENKFLYEGTFQIPADEADLAEGTLEIKVTNVKDLAGNGTTLTDQTKTSNGRRVIYDRTKPAGKVTSSNNNGGKPTNQDVVATLKTEEYVKTPEGWTVVVEGHKFTRVYTKNTKTSVKVIDNAGNENTIPFEIKRIDKVAPELTITDSEKYQLEVHSEYIDKGYSAYDKVDKDVTKLVKKAYEFQAKGENEYKSVEGIDTSKLGTYKVTYTAYDKAGNTTIGTREVEIVDTTAPTINLAGTAGKNNNELIIESGTEISLDDILAKVIDNYDEATTLKPYKADLLISNVASENKYNIKDFSNGLNTNYVGRYNVYYEHEDSNGNKSKATMLIVMKDTIKPEIILPGTAGKNKNELIVESGTKITYDDLIAQVEDVTAEKTVAPKKADLLISNVASENKYNIQDFSNGLSTAYVGRYNIQYTITDKGENTTTKTMLLIMKDSVKPELSAKITDGRTYITGKDVTDLQFNVYKNGELKHSYNSATSDAGKTFSLSTGWFGNGIYIIEAVDKGGNKTTLETYVTSNELTALNYIDTVKLTKDITLDELLTIAAGTTKTIDLNNHKLIVKNTNADHSRMIKNYGKLIIKNGTLVNENYDSYGLVDNYATGELVIENVKVKDNGSYDGSSIKNRGGNVTVTNSDFTIVSSKGYGLITGADYGNDDEIKYGNTAVYNEGTLTIKNTKITSDSERAYALNLISGTATVEDVNVKGNHGGLAVTGGTAFIKDMSSESDVHYGIYVANNSPEGTNITIDGGKFVGQLEGMLLYNSADKGDIQVTINGGEFSSKTTAKALRISKGTSTHEMNVTIKGGTFKDTDVSEYVADGYRQNSEWTVTESSKIDSVSYLKEVATIGGSYILDSDLTVNDDIITIPAGVNLTINTNGKTINAIYSEAKATSIFNVATGASLKLTGNGTLTYTAEKPDSTNYSYSSSTIVNKGNLEIDGPTLINTTAKGAPYVIDNGPGAVFTLTSGTIKQSGPNRAIRLYSYDGGAAVNAKLNGGTVTGSMAVYIHLISSTQSKAPVVNLTVNGGIYSSTDANGFAFYSYSNGNSMENIDVTFNGGAFNGYVAFGGGTNKTHKEKVTVNGGTFSHGIGRYLESNGWEDIPVPTQE